jgi:hypothetical protein
MNDDTTLVTPPTSEAGFSKRALTFRICHESVPHGVAMVLRHQPGRKEKPKSTFTVSDLAAIAFNSESTR